MYLKGKSEVAPGEVILVCLGKIELQVHLALLKATMRKKVPPLLLSHLLALSVKLLAIRRIQLYPSRDLLERLQACNVDDALTDQIVSADRVMIVAQQLQLRGRAARGSAEGQQGDADMTDLQTLNRKDSFHTGSRQLETILVF